jgi:hypothetical protein
MSRHNVVGCRQEVVERVKKTKNVPNTKKKEKLPIKLLDDPKIPHSDEILEDHTTPISLSTLPPR